MQKQKLKHVSTAVDNYIFVLSHMSVKPIWSSIETDAWNDVVFEINQQYEHVSKISLAPITKRWANKITHRITHKNTKHKK